MKLPGGLRGRGNIALPSPLAVELDHRIAAIAIGTSTVTARAEPVPLQSVICAAKHLSNIYNKEVEKEIEVASAVNSATFTAFKEEKISGEEAVRRHVRPPKSIKMSFNKTWASRFLQKKGLEDQCRKHVWKLFAV